MFGYFGRLFGVSHEHQSAGGRHRVDHTGARVLPVLECARRDRAYRRVYVSEEPVVEIGRRSVVRKGQCCDPRSERFVMRHKGFDPRGLPEPGVARREPTNTSRDPTHGAVALVGAGAVIGE